MMPVGASGEVAYSDPLVTQAIESEATSLHLSLQQPKVFTGQWHARLTPCRAFEYRFDSRRQWTPLDGCTTFQYRRHFTIIKIDPGGTVLVAAALTQSRWDYLRQNWSKLREMWSWPYPRGRYE